MKSVNKNHTKKHAGQYQSQDILLIKRKMFCSLMLNIVKQCSYLLFCGSSKIEGVHKEYGILNL